MFTEVPPRVDYELTEVGRTLIGSATNLASWASEQQPAISEARSRLDNKQETKQ
ncbi:winged helix-turn-helix transcriptional regulator [Paeniglutamicibacter sp. ZC-3]|uniref:winged helix-turn-helix transcriptional regulator n=1 Tax=Paeniglutamicibacter sp. ZC-3 TaxID=2986919 RepID=UPI0021F76411|nr:winged helix-turn-helix transcriptional regulator [Paeniglutamicibacter sp. ZC-3]MCV9994314.1 winged helix-turn-helix transcriptional regulator [Paeniglutamicibacter sp. ZC-3]